MSDHVINYGPNDPRGDYQRDIVRVKRISWPAIFAGVLVALAAEILFTAFGVFIGFQAFYRNPTVWSIIWFLVSCFVCIGAGAWVSARLSGNPDQGRLHGLVTWGLAVFTTFVLVTTVAWGAVTQTIRVAETAAVATAQAVPQSTTSGEASRMADSALNEAQRQMPNIQSAAATGVTNASLAIWVGLLVAAFGALVGGSLGAPRYVPPPPAA